MCLDYTYCTRECREKECIHNKKHLEGLYLDGKRVVTAISWSNFTECEKGDAR